MTFARGTCLGASSVCIAVWTITDDLLISDETGPVAEGLHSFGILMYVRCVNVVIVVKELGFETRVWEGFETA